MPQRLTIEYVKSFIKDKTNGMCEILDSSYTNSSTPLTVQCKCGNIFKRDFHHIQRGQLYCNECKNNLESCQRRKSIEDVIKDINRTGCTYVSGKYVNNNSILKIRCRCGNIFEKRAIKFFSGQDRCPECGNKNISLSKIKYTSNDVEQIISKSGYKMLNKNEYIDTAHKFKCICSKGHEFYLNFGAYLNGKSGCKKCANAMMSGSNHWNYKGGSSEVIDLLRKSLIPWKNEIKSLYGEKCAISKESVKRLDVHHIDNFLDILESCSKELNIDIKDKLSDYDNYSQYEILKNALIEKHNSHIGILISHSIHAKFHNAYLGNRTTRKQFDEFIYSNYGVRLNEILK